MFESVTTTAECHETLLIDPLTVLAERICKLLNDFDIVVLQEVPCTASSTPLAHGVCSGYCRPLHETQHDSAGCARGWLGALCAATGAGNYV